MLNSTNNDQAEHKSGATFADVAGHEQKQSEEFPLPQETIPEENANLPASGGVSDLLNKNTHEVTEDPVQPPNPNKSFAAATSNEGFPSLQEQNKELEQTQESKQNQESAPLSDLPDVKDMLDKPSVHVPPVPPSQSFAKIAAKEITPEKKPLSSHAQNIVKEKVKIEEDPMEMTDENFPTLGQSNLMNEENASIEDKAIYSEISRLNNAAEEIIENGEEDKSEEISFKKSFADITGSNLENAPPSAVSHVDKFPVYDENTIYLEAEKREERKENQVEKGNNEQLLKEQDQLENLGDKEVEKQKKENKVAEEKERSLDRDDSNKSISEMFNKKRTGKINVFETMFTLYRSGYNWLAIIPGAYLMHLRLSPLTSPYNFPFIYHSVFDLILLPIYTKNLSKALTVNTPMLHQNKEKTLHLVQKYGHKEDSDEGLSYWDGLKATRQLEKDTLRWWQVSAWAVHRIQWTLTYTMLHDPKTKLVSTPTLLSLSEK